MNIKNSISLSDYRFRRRTVVPFWYSIFIRFLAIILALLLVGVILKISGLQPITLASKALRQTLGTGYGIQQALVLATPLTMTGLAVAIGMQMRLWNIGADGQLFAGALAATAVGLFVQGPAIVVIPLMFLAGMAGGLLWILIPAILNAFWNVNEIITTLLLNFVAVLLVNYFAIGPWRDTQNAILSATRRIPYELPTLENSYLHIGILFPFLTAILLALLIQNTKWGYEVRVVGNNRRAAEYAGIPTRRHIVVIMLLSGAIAGLAGMVEVSATAHRLSGTISNNYGYMGIIVAALAGGSPLGVLVSGFLLAVLLNAGIVLQTSGLSVNAMLAINGLILIFAAIGEVVTRYQLVREKAESPFSHTTLSAETQDKDNPGQPLSVDQVVPEKERIE